MTADSKNEVAQLQDPLFDDETGKSAVPVAEAEKTEETYKMMADEASALPPSIVVKCSSFREESYFLSDLKENEKKALMDLRGLIEEAILENKLFENSSLQKKESDGVEKLNSSESKADENSDVFVSPVSKNSESESFGEEVSVWGVPLLPSKGSESTNVILLKFLRAREFKVKDAYEMLVKMLQWRKKFNIDAVLDEDVLGDDGGDISGACYMDDVDREGHPVCYNVLGIFQDEKLYQKIFGSKEGREKFQRWRIQAMEKGIQKLDLKPGSVVSMLQVTDLKDSPGLLKKEMRSTMKQIVQKLQDNYPEFVAKNIFINVPIWYYALNALSSPFLTQRTKSKFVFARPSKIGETLLKYIPGEAIPVKYGGLKRGNDGEFSIEDGAVSELVVKAGSTETIEFSAPEAGTTLLWDLTVLGWEVNYKEEFIPSDEGSYTIIVQKSKKMSSQEEPMRNSFKNNEPGKIVLTIENNTFRKKKVMYRYKTKFS